MEVKKMKNWRLGYASHDFWIRGVTPYLIPVITRESLCGRQTIMPVG